MNPDQWSYRKNNFYEIDQKLHKITQNSIKKG